MTFAPRTWVVGEVVTAAYLNQEIRDQFNSIFAAWTTYAPAWTAATNPVIGNGTINGRYQKVGRTVIFEANVFPGSTTTYGSGSWAISLPTTSATKSTTSLVQARLYDASAAANYGGVGQVTNADTAVRFFASTSGTSNIGPSTPFVWAAVDEFRVSGTYEAAS